MPKRRDEERRPPGGDNPEGRRRQFEDSRGLSERPVLPLEEEGPGYEPDPLKPSPEDEEEPPLEDAEPSRDESDLDAGRDAQ